MRVAMVASTDAYWTPLYARHFQERGYDVRIFSLTRDPLQGFDVVYVSNAVGAWLPRPLRFLAQVPRVRRLLKQFAPDVVLATYMSSNGMTAALAWDGPLVVSGHGGDVLRQAGYLPGGDWLHRHMMRFECARADIVHVVADELMERLVAYGIPRGRIECFPLGIEVRQFPMSVRAPSDVPHIVCTRRQEPVYANDVVVSALARLRDRGVTFRCTLVGGGPQLPERRAQVDALDLAAHVACVGQVPLAEVRAILASGDVYVSASTSDGTSSSLLEGMACGLLPVVSRIRANEPWVEHGTTGLLFEIGDVDGLAAALERALAEPAMRAAAAGRNRALVERQGDLVRNTDRMAHLLERVAGKPQLEDALQLA